MIKGVHTMFYSSEPEALRAFLRDKLGFSTVQTALGCAPRPGTRAILGAWGV